MWQGLLQTIIFLQDTIGYLNKCRILLEENCFTTPPNVF